MGVIEYLCPECGGRFTVEEAVELGFRHCGRPLRRERRFRVGVPAPPSASSTPASYVVEVLPPSTAPLSAEAVESLIAGMSPAAPFALEIASRAGRRRFYLRAPTRQALAYLQRQLVATYGHVGFRTPERDPAGVEEGKAAAAVELTLGEMPWLPLRVFRDDQMADSHDPLRGVLAAMECGPGEEVFSQLVVGREETSWLQRWLPRGSQAPREEGGQMVSLLGCLSLLPLALSVSLAVVPLTLFFLKGLLWGGLALIAWMALAGAGLWGFLWLRRWSLYDVNLVRAKALRPVYRCRLRIRSTAPTAERARAILMTVVAAYGRFREANRLVPIPPDGADLRTLREGNTPLSTAEIGALWHLPRLDDGLPTLGVRPQLAPMYPGLPDLLREGMPLGVSFDPLGQAFPAHLPPEALQRHILLLGMTQVGKSTALGALAEYVMRMGHGLVVVDPHGKLAQEVLGRVPPERAGDVYYLDLTSAERAPSFNFLDPGLGIPPDITVEALLDVMEDVWEDYWGPRMEDVMRAAIMLLLTANINGQDPPFSVVDVALSLESQCLREKIMAIRVDDPRVCQWMDRYLESMDKGFRDRVINPVLSKIHHILLNQISWRFLGYPYATFNLLEALAEGKVVILNADVRKITHATSALVSSVFLNFVGVALTRSGGTPVTVIVDEFRVAEGVKFGNWLAQIVKMGGRYVLAAQALAQFDEMDTSRRRSRVGAMREVVLGNTDTIICFRVNAADAQYMAVELGLSREDREKRSLMYLPDYQAVVRTIGAPEERTVNVLQRGGYTPFTIKGAVRLPPFTVATHPPPKGDPGVMRVIRERMTRYTVPLTEMDVVLERLFRERMDIREAAFYPQGDGKPTVVAVGRHDSGEALGPPATSSRRVNPFGVNPIPRRGRRGR